MSTKTTIKYVDTRHFSMHLYEDFAGSPGLKIRVNNSRTTILLSKDELDDIVKQLEGD